MFKLTQTGFVKQDILQLLIRLQQPQQMGILFGFVYHGSMVLPVDWTKENEKVERKREMGKQKWIENRAQMIIVRVRLKCFDNKTVLRTLNVVSLCTILFYLSLSSCTQNRCSLLFYWNVWLHQNGKKSKIRVHWSQANVLSINLFTGARTLIQSIQRHRRNCEPPLSHIHNQKTMRENEYEWVRWVCTMFVLCVLQPRKSKQTCQISCRTKVKRTIYRRTKLMMKQQQQWRRIGKNETE